MAIVISGVNNNDKITASDGTIDLLSGVNYIGEITAPSLKVGSNIQFGNAGIITATTFTGNLTGNVNATSNLLLQIGGSEKFRVASSGQLGIGGANYGTSGQVLTSGGSGSAATWSTIASDKITEGNTEAEVVDTGSDGHFKVTTEGSERLRIDSSGRVLVGTQTQFGDGNDKLMIENGTTGGRLTFGSSAGFAEPIIGQMSAYWADNKKVAAISFFGGGDTTNKDDGTIRFATSSANNLTERLRIASNGDVGIGTNNPASRLDVRDNSSNNYGTTIRLAQGYNTVFSEISSNFGGSMTLNAGQGGGAPVLHFQVNDDEKMRLDNSGNLTIGTSSWSYPKRLNVQGSSGSILSLYNADTTTYAADTNSSIEFKLLTGNTGNQTGTCEIRAFKDNGTNGNNARGLSFWTGGTSAANAARLTINSSGQVTKPYQYVFTVSTNGSSGFSKAANWEKITGLAPYTSQCTGVSDGTNWSNSTQQFTAPVTGVYHFFVGGWANGNQNGQRYGYVFKHTNGNNYAFIGGGNYAITDSPMDGFSRTIKLSAGEWVELWGFSAITNVWGGGHRFFWGGYLLG